MGVEGRAFCTEDLCVVKRVVVADESEELFVHEILVLSTMIMTDVKIRLSSSRGISSALPASEAETEICRY